MNNKDIFCIVPAYKEEKNISRVVEELSDLDYSVVVVVDGGGDKTFEFALETKRKLKNSNIYILQHLINRGQGAALQTGNDFALKKGAKFVVHFDADGQFLSSEIIKILKPILDDKCDIVFGSRFLEIKSNMPFFKEFFIMPIGRIVNKIFLGVNLSDPQNGFRAMNALALEKIKISQDGSAHCSEILGKTIQNNLRYSEIAVTVIYNDFGQGLLSGKGRGKGGLKIIRDLILGKIIN